MDHRVLTVFLWLWGSGFQAEVTYDSTGVFDDVRLVGSAKHCDGKLEMKHQGDWEAVTDKSFNWTLTMAAAVCRQLNCGSVVSLRRNHTSTGTDDSPHPLSKVLPSHSPDHSFNLEITCTDSVRLVNGSSLCSGRLEVKSNQSWSPVCEDVFDLQDAEVVCRELGCGAPSVLQAGLYGEGRAPVWTEEFQCEGNESALLDCGRSTSARKRGSPGKAVGLVCSESDDVRLVGGASRCSGTLDVKQWGEWKPVDDQEWNLSQAGIVCGLLNCGSAVSTGRGRSSLRFTWKMKSVCNASSLLKCFTRYSPGFIAINCSDSVRLVNGSSLCSGRLEVRFNQAWYSVCEDDFDLQDAEVVCRELGCGAPLELHKGLYGDVEAPAWMRGFRCNGHESALLGCGSSGSVRNTCSSHKAVGLTCSAPDDVRLVGGVNRCTGTLELKHHGDWRVVDKMDFELNLKVTAVICQWLDCGSSVSAAPKQHSSEHSVWWIKSSCLQSKSTLNECVIVKDKPSDSSIEITCSDSVRLVNGSSLCSGRLEVKSNQSWSAVCEDAFDLQDAEVVCRELGCGAPSVLQAGLYGEGRAPVWTEEFQCEGNESSLLDCGRSTSARKRGSPGKAVGLVCLEGVRLVGEVTHCAGRVELKTQGEWRPVADWFSDWDLESAAAVCRLLDCGFAVSTEITDDPSERPVWWVTSSCVKSKSSLLECLLLADYGENFSGLQVVCSDLLASPIISPDPSIQGVYNGEQQRLQVLMGTDFTITCSVEPLYEGGSFQLLFKTCDTAQNYTMPAVNHSAHFLFSAAEHTHQGYYSCVHHVNVFSHNFSFESQPLFLTISASLSELMIRLAILLLGMMLLVTACLYFQPGRSHMPGCVKRAEINDCVLGSSSTEDWLGEKTAAQRKNSKKQWKI